MLKNYFSLVLVFLILGNIYSQTTAIPDANFEQALIDLGIDSDGIINGSVATSDISGVSYLDISNKSIRYLIGIQDFTNLTELYCQNNNLFDVTVSHNTQLKILNCSHQYDDWVEPFTINVSQNTDLEYLNFSGNRDLSGGLNPSLNPNLKTLICSSSGLTSLNVSQNAKLEYLDCASNYYIERGGEFFPFTNLTLGQHTNLTTINCSSNEISNLDLSGIPALKYLDCSHNKLHSIDLTQNTNLEIILCQYNWLSSLSMVNNSSLIEVYCYNNRLDTLNVKNGNKSILLTFDAQNNPNLTCIQVDDADAANNGIAPYDNWSVDNTVFYSENCSALRIPDEVLTETVILYPNPFTNTLTINSGIPLTKVEIYSVTGRKVKEVNSDFNSIQTNNLSNGVYVVRMFSENGMTAKKLIKN